MESCQLEKTKSYAAKFCDDEQRIKSQSGGAFYALAKVVIDKGGAVYGCALSENFEAQHVRVEDYVGLERLRGSKYVQSAMGDVFLRIREDLKRGKAVLFSGTPCQISGLRAYLDVANILGTLYCVDIICHGVPSPRVWRDFLQWRSRGSSVLRADFRNKLAYGWRSHVESLWLKNAKGHVRRRDSRVYTSLFYSHNTLRPCCYQCPYKSVSRQSNVTIGDCWGIENAAPQFADEKGVSIVLINDEKGDELFRIARDSLDVLTVPLESCLQPALVRPFPCPSTRKQFWKDYDVLPFGAIAQKYGNLSLRAWMRLVLDRMVFRFKTDNTLL